MKSVLFLMGLAALAVLAALAFKGWQDRREVAKHIASLTAHANSTPMAFSHAMIADLPAPAQRFFRFAVAEGAPLYTVADVAMGGTFDMGNGAKPNQLPMSARQVIAPPHGFVWRSKMGKGLSFSGSDGLIGDTSWTRFRMLGLLSVARVGGDADHHRSAFGRLVGDSLIWLPTAFLAQANAGWDSLAWAEEGKDTAAVTVRRGGLEETVYVTVDEAGRPQAIWLERWSNENAGKTYRRQPFGGALSDFETVSGLSTPARVIAGNHYGTQSYHPFFDARVEEITYR